MIYSVDRIISYISRFFTLKVMILSLPILQVLVLLTIICRDILKTEIADFKLSIDCHFFKWHISRRLLEIISVNKYLSNMHKQLVSFLFCTLLLLLPHNLYKRK